MANLKMRVVIVDDEPLARDRLRALLGAHPDVEIVAECANGEEAAAMLKTTDTDAVFLDVHMPGMDGFDVLDALGPDLNLFVIFLTAHDEHAVRAFETRAIDYILKPASRARLEEALDRVRERISAGAPRTQRIAVRDGSRVTFVSVREIDWIEAAGNYAVLHAGNRTHVVRETMGALESFLPGDGFLRLSRSAIVNLDRVAGLENRAGRVSVTLHDGTRISSTRPIREIEERLRR